ncbi:MAG: VWA domain-containing protein [Gemmatimonadales bacterium]|nr:MAG: VWA domain-containing protein [Gemmatimonadales bacterium]
MYRQLTLVAALTVGAATALPAQGWVELETPRRPGIVMGPVVRVSSNVRTTIDGRVARVEVEEQFRNTGPSIAEGSYLYPLPKNAVFSDFSLWMGEQEITGEIMNAGEAQKIYEDIVRRLKDPALLSFEGHGLIRARVFPIQAGETRRVKLRYTQVLERAGDAMRLRYSIGPRHHGPEHGQGGTDASFRDNFSYQVTVPSADDIGTPYSPTHPIETEQRNGRLIVTLSPNAVGDVDLFIPLRRGLVGTSILTHAPGGEDGFFMLLLAPPHNETGQVVPRDLSLVVDVSGSMSGDKLEQAKQAMTQALGTLRPADRFRLVAFSSGIRHFREGFTPATAANLAQARRFVANLTATGGTNIAGALDAVLGSAVAEDRLPIIVFMTDGLPSVGEREPDRIAEAASSRIGRARIFTVGVGHDVNTYLLDRLAVEGRGSAEYVAPDADVEVAVGSLLSKIQFPALVNLRIVSSPVEFRQDYPAELPDLFYGEELVVFGRYHGQATGTVVIEGERNGRRERFTARAAFPRSEHDNDYIPRLWAARRIGDLTRTIRIEGSTPDLINEVRDLGLRYGIITEYTSYLVLEPGMQPGVARDDMRQNAPMTPALQGGARQARAQTGREAFKRAEASSEMASAKTLAAADAVAESRMRAIGGLSDEREGDAVNAREAQVRRVAGRLFVRHGATWTDARHSDSLTVIEVAPFSDAYFALVRALPEIRPYLSTDGSVLVAGRQVSIKFAAAGLESMSERRINQVVRMFRGT